MTGFIVMNHLLSVSHVACFICCTGKCYDWYKIVMATEDISANVARVLY